MIHLGLYVFVDWNAVKYNWKRGVRGEVHGCATEHAHKKYEIGEGFILYPDLIDQEPGHLCDLFPEVQEETENRGGPYGKDYSILSPSGNGLF